MATEKHPSARPTEEEAQQEGPHLHVAPPRYDWAEDAPAREPRTRRLRRLGFILLLEALLLAAILAVALVPEAGRWTREFASPVVTPLGEALDVRGGDDADNDAARPAKAQGSAANGRARNAVRRSGVLAASREIVFQPSDARIRTIARVTGREARSLAVDSGYRRLAVQAATLAERIRAILKNGVTAAERARLLRLRIRLARLERAMIARRIALLRGDGLTAAERAQVAKLSEAATIVNRTILRRRIALVTLGGVTAAEQPLLSRLETSLQRVERKLDSRKTTKGRRRYGAWTTWSHTWQEPEEEVEVTEDEPSAPAAAAPSSSTSRRRQQPVQQQTVVVEETEEEVVEETGEVVEEDGSTTP